MAARRTPSGQRRPIFCDLCASVFSNQVGSFCQNGFACGSLFWFLFSARDLFGQRSEFWLPEMAERLQPPVNVFQASGVERINTPRTVDAHRCESVLSQYLEMLRYGRLRDPELFANEFNHLARRQRLVGQMFENSPAHRIAQNIKSVHSN